MRTIITKVLSPARYRDPNNPGKVAVPKEMLSSATLPCGCNSARVAVEYLISGTLGARHGVDYWIRAVYEQPTVAL